MAPIKQLFSVVANSTNAKTLRDTIVFCLYHWHIVMILFVRLLTKWSKTSIPVIRVKILLT
jgi:hypothetical protein